MNDAILILGASVMQSPAMRLAKAKGYIVHAADGNPKASHAHEADFFHVVDLKDLDGMLALARKIAESSRLLGVFTAGTDFSATVAYVASAIGLPGIPYEVALDASIKTRMREAFARNGVPSPAFSRVASVSEARAAAARVGYPVVVKPVDNMGARGVRRVDAPEGIEAACTEALGHSRTASAIVERYVEGPEFSLDAIVTEGKVHVCGIADRHIFFPPYFVEMGHTMPSAHSPSDQTLVVQAFIAGVNALGIKNGAAKGDIKLSREGAYVGEIAARLSGGYMSGWTYPYSSGIEVTSLALDVACGVKPDFSAKPRSDVAAERAFISIPGNVRELIGIDEAKAIPNVRDLFTRVRPGDAVVFPKNNVEKCGNIIAVAPGRHDAVHAAETAAARVIIRLEPNRISTEAFLAGTGREFGPDGSAFPPDAFSPISAGVRSRLEELALREKSGGSIIPMPELLESELRDWQGRTIAESLELLGTIVPLEFSPRGCPQFSSKFWHSLIRGGIQGALYAYDSRFSGNS